jgi:Glycosyl transferase family 90
MFVGSIQPWTHYIPVEQDMSDIEERFEFILQNEDKVKIIIKNANDWCASNLQYTILQDHFLSTVTQFLQHLDAHDIKWQQTWMDKKDKYLSGHFMLYRQNAYSLPKPVVGAIKQGLRHDSPSYNATSGNVERTLMDSITSKWGKQKQADYMLKLKQGKQ